MAVIVVATADFEVYHDVVEELRDRNVRFDTLEPGEELPDAAAVAIVGPEDEHPPIPTVRASPDHPRRAVETALANLRGKDGRTVVGVDPGDRPGIVVMSGGTVVAAFQVPGSDAPEIIERELEDAADPLVRIGDGARLRGARIVDAIESAPVELVDETGTTPYQGRGVRGMGDVLAAVNIARTEGEEVESRDVEPTVGEIRMVQERSRERGDDQRAIDEELARQVALGKLSMGAALSRHRDRDDG
ncbi:MAG: hypothetical protein ACI944_001023 [Natronomonas sp.]